MTKKDKGGYEHDLREAENAIVAAGPDMAALALAQRRHAEAIRNYMQGAIVPMFVEMTERSLSQLIAPLSAGIDGLRTDVQHSAAETAARLKKFEAGLAALNGRLAAGEQERAAIAEKLDTYIAGNRRAELHQRVTALEDYRVQAELDTARFEAVEAAIRDLAARIESALPTEADQDLSTQLRADRDEQRDAS